MQTLIKKAALAGVLAISLGTALSAKAGSLGTIVGLAPIVGTTAAGAFTDFYTFTVGAANDGAVFMAMSITGGTTGVTLDALKLYSGTYTTPGMLGTLSPLASNTILDITPLPDTAYTFYVAAGNSGWLTPGASYTLTIAGDSIGAGGYTGQVILAPVPEPESYAMLLAGIGMMGMLAHKKRKQ